jgi:hypothetical protein
MEKIKVKFRNISVQFFFLFLRRVTALRPPLLDRRHRSIRLCFGSRDLDTSTTHLTPHTEMSSSSDSDEPPKHEEASLSSDDDTKQAPKSSTDKKKSKGKKNKKDKKKGKSSSDEESSDHDDDDNPQDKRAARGAKFTTRVDEVLAGMGAGNTRDGLTSEEAAVLSLPYYLLISPGPNLIRINLFFFFFFLQSNPLAVTS